MALVQKSAFASLAKKPSHTATCVLQGGSEKPVLTRIAPQAGRSSLDDAIAVWSRLQESDQARFFAAMLSAMMSKPASADELLFWVTVLREREARMIAELRSMSAGDEQ